MDVAITGASGLIGRALARSLESDGHRVVRVVRAASPAGASGDGTVAWDPTAARIDRHGLEGLDAVVHLAGEGIAARPWTAAQRRRIADSRRLGTQLLAGALAELRTPPAVLVSGSAIGIYGERGDDVLAEGEPAGHDFLAGVCVDWERATEPASSAGIRVARIRTGIVLDGGGGALAKMVPPFRLGLGAKAGDGQAWMAWISLVDEVRAIRHLIDTPEAVGAFNLTGPEPVRNVALTEAIGRAVHRRTPLTIPRALRRVPLGVGDLIGDLLFTSIRAVPRALESAGFEFAHPTVDDALAAALATTS